MESLKESLMGVVSRIRSSVLLDSREVDLVIRELQRALLKADVDVGLVLSVSERIKKRFFEEEQPPGFSKKEVLVKILYEELVNLLGGEETPELKVSSTPFKVMFVGLEGSGKTTTVAKVANYYKRKGYRVGVVAADTYRPGAYEQLRSLAEKVGVPFYGDPQERDAVSLALRGVKVLSDKGIQMILIDTAGRHKDEEALMEEVKTLYREVKPDAVVLVVDATQGSAVARQARAFQEAMPFGYVIVAKMDGSAKGGGALSAVASSKARVIFIGTGEKIEDLEEFNPKKFVARLLGMPDLEALLQRFSEFARLEKERARAIASGKITLLDLKEQLEGLRKMGPLSKIAEMMGLQVKVSEEDLNIDKWINIMNSMTMEELLNPEIIDSSRMRRIARGSGVSPRDVKQLLEAYRNMKKVMRQLSRSRMRGLPRGF
ncbi:signal recognition particle receptor subunit alpha [Thermofilum pendens]|uniref:Signal recognition particle 54 kDa protein n=1 Tax=Thermofilum pendens (strain DSM 2475 / Hrk 5) TaxID=368408 RepID=A1RXH9_THEPD|nr:signal recognition particle receptor subunit alpha [Thermofilum pendens]ABL77909.1 signal recognition particle subunit FFH/SRP54 (srp54) [Thermofilum pendens Hrk 5]